MKPKPNQSMKLTASKPAIYALGVCHPRLWFHGSPHRARRSLSLSRYATQSGDAPRYRISLDQRGGRKSTEANRGV
jgi:hypothetical protein